MISLEQVQLLESKVAKAIEYVQKVTDENSSLVSEKASLMSKLEANKKRLDELEVLVMRFKEDQGRIEDGIIAALDRLSQFEEAFENSLKEKSGAKKTAAKKTSEQEASSAKKSNKANDKEFFEIPKALEDVPSSKKTNIMEDDYSDEAEEFDEDEDDEEEDDDGELDIF